MARPKIFLTALYFAFNICIGQTDSSMTVAENYKTKHFNVAIFPASYIEFPLITNNRFTPTHSEIDKAEKSLRSKIKTISKDYPVIYKKLKKYLRQYVGYIDNNGNRVLVINCFLSNDDYLNDWLKNYFMILDGGSSVWEIKYNIKTDTFFEFGVNGFG
jgi:hypothetical protein